MQEVFDPYSVWLGVPAGPRPPDYYSLLGLAAFHPDLAAIAGSADHRMAFLQQHLAGPYAPTATQLMNELATARNMLLNPQSKAGYDAELYRRMQGAMMPQYAPMQMAGAAHNGYGQPGYAAGGYAQQPEPSAPAVSIRPRRYIGRKNSSMSESALVILAVAVLAVVGVGAFLVWKMNQTTPSSHPAPVATHTQGEVTPETPKETKTKPKGKTPETVATTTTSTTAPKPPVATHASTDPQEAATMKEALTSVRTSISDRKFSVAADKLKLAGELATSHDSKQEVENVRALLHYAKGFWDVVQSSWKNMTAGNEMEINGETIVIVEVTPDKLIIRQAGQNREYTVQRMPFSFGLTLGEMWLTKGDPNSYLFLAAVHLTDYKGDRRKARQLYNQASNAGVDVAWLQKELELAEKK